MIRADASLEAVRRALRRLGLRRRRDARIQAEHVELLARELVGELAHRLQRRQIADHRDTAARGFCRFGGPGAIPVRVVDRVAVPDQPFGRVEPYPLGGAGDGYVESRRAGKKYRGEQGGYSG